MASGPHQTSPRRFLEVLGQWSVLGAIVGGLAGCASALFLWLLDEATRFRGTHETIVFALPVAGFAIGWLYDRFGEPIRAGTDLVVDAAHERETPTIPLRMAPMVLVGTVLTHLFGGSAGREGTAVQMGAAMADNVAARVGVTGPLRQQLVAAGIAGGFGSVFGTPVAGTVFALEMVVIGHLRYAALVPAMIAALVGDQVCHAWGIGHTVYTAAPHVPLTPLLMGKWVLVAIAMALATTAFVELTHLVKKLSTRWLRTLALRMFGGGVVLVVLWQLVGTSDYLGLGVPMIVRAFDDPALPMYAFALKILFTAVTIGTGYLGGEVTPLFFVGATLGSVLARLLGIPIELGAGVGLAAVFATASNAPLALSIMTVEMLGAGVLPHVLIVCVLSYLLVGHRGIYGAQRLPMDKLGRALASPRTLREGVHGGGDTPPAAQESPPETPNAP